MAKYARRNLSGYASRDPHEFAAEAFTAVTLYGDDAPPPARRLVEEMETVQAAMDAETAAALAWRLPPAPYAEAQMFGPLNLADVKAIEVESLASSRTLSAVAILRSSLSLSVSLVSARSTTGSA